MKLLSRQLPYVQYTMHIYIYIFWYSRRCIIHSRFFTGIDKIRHTMGLLRAITITNFIRLTERNNLSCF